MSTTVTYKGQTLTTVENATKTLQTAGTWVEGDFTLTDVTASGGVSWDDIVDGQTTFDITINATTATQALSNLKVRTVNAPNLTSAPFYFLGSQYFTGGTFPSLRSSNRVCQGATNLVTVPPTMLPVYGNYASAATDYCLYGCTNLATVVLPGHTKSFSSNNFRNDKKLQIIDSPASGYGTNCVTSCTVLKTIIIRKSDACATLNNTGDFNGTPFASGGSGGTIYIPKALYDHLGDGTALDYKSATNWSTMDGYGTITWAQIEGSYYETHYADGSEVTA